MSVIPCQQNTELQIKIRGHGRHKERQRTMVSKSQSDYQDQNWFSARERQPSSERQKQALERIHEACTRGAKWNRKTRSVSRTHPERDEMVVLADYLDLTFGEYGWIHVPSEGPRSPRFGASLKAQGWKAGFPDVVVFGDTHTGRQMVLAIELKKPRELFGSESAAGRAVTEPQIEWQHAFGLLKIPHCVAYGADEAIEWIEKEKAKQCQNG